MSKKNKGGGTYECGICGKPFATLSDRADHIRKEHAKPEEPWK